MLALPELFNAGTLVTVLLLLLTYVAHWYLTKPRDLPPGPPGMPLLGYIPFLGKHPPSTLAKLSDKYGSEVIGLYLGNKFVVVFNGINALRDAFVKQADTFSGRPRFREAFVSSSVLDKSSFLETDGSFFREHRRFIMQNLRDCGVGKSSLEILISDEIQHFLAELKRENGAPHDLRELLDLSLGNNTTLMLLGRRYDYYNSWFRVFKENMNQVFNYSNCITKTYFLPWLGYAFSFKWAADNERVCKASEAAVGSLCQLINEHKKSNPELDRHNYYNAFVKEQERRKEIDPNDETFSDKVLVSNVKMLLQGGTETSSNVLIWFLIHMMTYPEVQAKIHREIDDVIGRERMPSCTDQAMTPYTMAVITEILRITTMAPLALPHRSKVECYVHGYRIPKDTFVLANLWSIHNDAKSFPEPEKFRPERFLDENGMFVRPDNVVIFGLGLRQCVGEALARMELYLYTVAMMQAFEFRSPSGVIPSFESYFGITNRAKHFITQAILRS